MPMRKEKEQRRRVCRGNEGWVGGGGRRGVVRGGEGGAAAHHTDDWSFKFTLPMIDALGATCGPRAAGLHHRLHSRSAQL